MRNKRGAIGIECGIMSDRLRTPKPHDRGDLRNESVVWLGLELFSGDQRIIKSGP